MFTKMSKWVLAAGSLVVLVGLGAPVEAQTPYARPQAGSAYRNLNFGRQPARSLLIPPIGSNPRTWSPNPWRPIPPIGCDPRTWSPYPRHDCWPLPYPPCYPVCQPLPYPCYPPGFLPNPYLPGVSGLGSVNTLSGYGN